jgi:hypothetical protein
MGKLLCENGMCCKQPFHDFAKGAAEKERRGGEVSNGNRNRNV